MNTYTLCNTIINNTNYTSQKQKNEMQFKLDVFFANNRLTSEQYGELTTLLANKPIEIIG